MATLSNCTIAANRGFRGGGVVSGGTMPFSGDVTLDNCILWGNRDDGGGGQGAQLRGPILRVAYSQVESWIGNLGGTANSSADPLFADDRSTELMRYECRSSLARRDVTLFANGTVRLRRGPLDDQELYLDELRSEELTSYVRQLRQTQDSDQALAMDLPANAPTGDWVESCEIHLELPDAEPATYRFTAYEIPPLVVARLIHVAEDLAYFTRPLASAERLPKDYRPQPGDVLRSLEGRKFRVMNMTSDGRGVELAELGTPVMVLVPLAELDQLFSALEASGGR